MHLHPIPIPARERFARDQHENFYWLQEDYIRESAARQGWAFSIWRPQLIVGPNHGVVMNLPPIIGAFAAICREEGRPFGFPGGASWVWECVDTRLVADALAWGATSPNAVGRDVQPDERRGVRVAHAVAELRRDVRPRGGAGRAGVARRAAAREGRRVGPIVAKHGLRPIKMADLVGESHHYADFCFALGAEQAPPPAFVSTIKIKQAGFCGTWDTEESFRLLARGPHRPARSCLGPSPG